MLRALDGLRPARANRRRLVGRHLRLEAAIDLPVAGDLVAAFPHAGGQAGQVGGTQAVVSVTFGRTTGSCRTSAWNCSSASLTLAPPSTRSSSSSPAASLLHRVDQVGDLQGDAFDGRAGDVGGGRAARDADDRAAGIGIPMRAPRPANAGTKKTPPLSGTELASASTSDRRLDDAQPVAQPGHDRPADEHAAFERVLDLATELPGDRRQQLVLRLDRLRRRCSSA